MKCYSIKVKAQVYTVNVEVKRQDGRRARRFYVQDAGMCNGQYGNSILPTRRLPLPVDLAGNADTRGAPMAGGDAGVVVLGDR